MKFIYINIFITINKTTLSHTLPMEVVSSHHEELQDIEESKIDDKKFLIGKQILENLTTSIVSGNLQKNRLTLDCLLQRHCRKQGFSFTKTELTKIYNILLIDLELAFNEDVKNTITKKLGKSHSGIVSVTLVTSPGKFSCKYDCYYCPAEPNTPRSYVSTGPAVLRGSRNDYDAVKQFRDRAFALLTLGHKINKVELIVIGGTFSSHQVDYQIEFFRGTYFAANTMYDAVPLREILSLDEEIKINETAKCRLIGVTIETRPDCITPEELMRLRRYGVTRVQLGIQHIDDDILHLINRQCPTFKSIRAIKMLKANGFKIDAHLMPDLPGSSYDKDLEMFKFLFSKENETLQCDQLKIYPFMVTRWTEIEKWYLNGHFIPYSDKDECKLLFDLFVYIATNCPQYVRLNRVVRDIPGNVIHNKLGKHTNMYQDVIAHLKKENLKGTDMRAREVKLEQIDPEDCGYYCTSYRASAGLEYFISYETKDRDKLIGFLRLRANDIELRESEFIVFDELRECALIRELHVYGKLTDVGKQATHYQHVGVGKSLLKYAENISLAAGFSKIAVIAGVGAREYYKKYGYILCIIGGYMIKNL